MERGNGVTVAHLSTGVPLQCLLKIFLKAFFQLFLLLLLLTVGHEMTIVYTPMTGVTMFCQSLNTVVTVTMEVKY